MFENLLPNYAKRKFTSADYEYMVMKVQQDVDERTRIGKFHLKSDQESSNIQKCLDIWKDVNYMKLLTRRNINSGVSNFVEKDMANTGL